MDLVKKISQQTLWQILGKAVTTLSTFLILGAVSRVYGQPGTGLFTLVLAYLAFFYIAADLGFNAHIIKQFLLGDMTDPFRRLLGLRITLSFICALLAVALASLWSQSGVNFIQAVLIASLTIFTFTINTTANAIFQARLRYDLMIMATIFGSFLTLALIFLTVGSTIPIPLLYIPYVLGGIASASLALIFVKKYLPAISPILDLQFAKKLIKETWPISLTLVLNTVYFRVDTFLLSFLKPLSDVGIYNVAYSVFQSALVLPTFIMNGFYPLMIKSLAEDKQKFKTQLFYGCLIMFGLAVLGTLLTLVLAPLVITLLTGGGFTGSVDSLKMLSLGFPAYFVSALLMWTLITLKKYKTLLAIYLAGLVVNFLLNLMLIPRYSFMATSSVTVISEYLILTLELIILIPTLLKK